MKTIQKLAAVVVLALAAGGCTTLELGYGKAGEPGPTAHSVFGTPLVARSPEPQNGPNKGTAHSFSDDPLVPKSN